MADHEDCKSEGLSIGADHVEDVVLALRVEASRGFVEEDDLWICDKSTCQGDAFFHASRDFGRVFVA